MLTSHRVVRLLVAVLLVGSVVPAAQPVPTLPSPRRPLPPEPPRPQEHEVVIRYRIEAARNERLRRYFQMMEFLSKAGFVRSPQDEPSQIEPLDTNHTRVAGTLSRSSVARVLEQPDVQAILLAPKGKTVPGGEEPVRVELRLTSSLPLPEQRELHAQVSQALRSGGYREAVGYDTRRATRVVGQIPTSRLSSLLEDLRRQPGAWPLLPKSFLADIRRDPAGGPDLLDRVFEQWRKNEAGSKLLLDHVQRWQAFPGAVEFARTLPGSTANDPVLLLEAQIRNFTFHPESEELLSSLLDEARKSEAAPVLMDDLLSRVEAAGVTRNLPLIFRASPPIRIVEAQPDWPLPAIPGSTPEIPKGQEKFTAEFRALLANPEEAKKPRRFEFLLRDPIPETETRWFERYDTLPVGVEGKFGSIVTVIGPPEVAPQIAALPEVIAIRLPLRADAAQNPARDLKADCGEGARRVPGMVRQFADAGRLRQMVLVGADFRGWEAFKGDGLPASTRLLDLTSERNANVEPDPYPGDPRQTGLGTQAALDLVRMANTVNLLLVRIDPESPYQLDYVARLTAGQPDVSLSLRGRLRDLTDDRDRLNARGDALTEERNRLLLDFRPETQQLRAEYEKKKAQYDQDRVAFEARQARLLTHELLTNELRKMRVVWNTLSWDEGYAVFDTGSLSRFLDDRPYPGVWLQSRGGDVRRLWYGLFRDADTSGSLDLLPPGASLPADRWNPDLGFLAWKNPAEERVMDLPAGAVLRVAIQWKEVHDADLARMGDYYLEPLARLDLQAFHQVDPRGEKQPADDLVLVAQSSGTPRRILNSARFSVYEQSLEFRVEKPGRYLIQVVGMAPESTRPKELPTIPIAREVAELHPRIVVRTLAGAGEALFEDPPRSRAALPMPADAQRAVTVGEQTYPPK